MPFGMGKGTFAYCCKNYDVHMMANMKAEDANFFASSALLKENLQARDPTVLLQCVDKFLRGLGENLIPFPYNGCTGCHFWKEGTKAQVALPTDIDQFVKTERITQPLIHQQRGIEDKIVGSNNI